MITLGYERIGEGKVMGSSRRDILGLIGSLAVAGGVGPQRVFAQSADTRMPSRLYLLGTGGGPIVGAVRRMTCNAIAVGERAYVIDCGYGASEALVKAGIALKQISSLFITHNHADHMLDYGALLFLSWLQGHKAKLDVYGPPPLKEITRNQLAANDVPLQYYKTDMATGPMPPVNVHELSAEGLIMDDGVAKVRCTLVDHKPVIPSLAYRFDLPDRSIVFSGDTAPAASLVKLAKGADILVHEAYDIDAMLSMMEAAAQGNSAADKTARFLDYDEAKFREHVLKAHTAVEDAAKMAAAAEVRTLVLNHLAPSASNLVTDAQWLAKARRHFHGEIVVAHDGMVL